MKSPFSIKESLRLGWRVTHDKSSLVFPVVLTLFAIETADAIVKKVFAHTLLGGVASAVLVLLSIFASAGAAFISLKLARGEDATYSELFLPWRITARFTAAGLLAMIVEFAPVVLVVFFLNLLAYVYFPNLVRGNEDQFFSAVTWYQLWFFVPLLLVSCAATLYLVLRLSLVKYLILDGSGMVESLRESRRLTQGHIWKLLQFFCAFAGVNILGFCMFGIGLLVTLPLTVIAFAFVYDKLKAVELEA